MNKHESIRIDNQLRGRSGRQGDPGESCIFVSLEDDLMQKYDLKNLIDSYKIEPDKDGRIADKHILREVNRIQRIAQGAAFDARNMLVKYSYILEEQRKLITEERMKILFGEKRPHILSEREPDLFLRLLKTAGSTGIDKAERQLMLYFINRNWAEYLETMSSVRDGIHLMVIGGKNPVDEYHRIAIETFVQMIEAIKNDVLAMTKTAEITPDGIDMEKEGLLGGTTTWTYLIDESSDQFSRLPYLVGAVSNQIRGAVFSISDSLKKLFRSKKQ
jgi:Preprotein translocase subunit SecA (ATPase, RNA helicase)